MEQTKRGENQTGAGAVRRRGRWKMLLVLAVCAAPLVFSYFTYYVVKPTARNNYGELLNPREHPIPPDLGATTLDGRGGGLQALRGKWVMLQTGPSACAEACHKQLFAMQQLRLMQGKEMGRIERVWLVTDGAPLDTLLMREFDGTAMLRASARSVANWLPVDRGDTADGHIYLIDPQGHLMMRFPRDPDPARVKKDLGKLLAASAIG